MLPSVGKKAQNTVGESPAVDVLQALETATGTTALSAALAAAKAQGFSNKHESFKAAKRRLFALNSGVAFEELPKTKGKKRKRKPAETSEEVVAPLAKRRHKDSTSREDEGQTLEKSADKAKARKIKRVDGGPKQSDASHATADSGAVKDASRCSDATPAKVSLPSFQVRIAGFPDSLDEAVLRTDFRKYGKILDLVLINDNKGNSRSIAFISFASESGQEGALKLHGEDYKGQPLKVKKVMPSDIGQAKGKGNSDGAAKGTGKGENTELKVFVGGLPYTAEEVQVKELFGKCGEFDSFFMPVHRASKRRGQCKGFVLITYKTQKGVRRALKLNGTSFMGHSLIIEKKGESEKKPKGSGKGGADSNEFEVFVGGLYSIKKSVIKKHFEECGEIESFEMPLTSKGESKGIAFIAYKSAESLEKALLLHGTQLRKHLLTVERKVAKDSKDRDKGDKKSQTASSAPLQRSETTIAAPIGLD